MPRPVITSPKRKRRNDMTKTKRQVPTSKFESKSQSGARTHPHSKSTSCEISQRAASFREAFGVRTRPLVAFDKRQVHSIVRDAHLDTAFGSNGAKLCGDFALVACDDFRSAMRDNGARHALFFTPGELRADRRMTDQCFAAPPNERECERGAVADVNSNAIQRSLAFVNKDQVRRVEDARTPCIHSVSDRRGENGMFYRERFECDPTNFRRRTFFNYGAMFDRIVL